MYASYVDIENRLGRKFSEEEISICNSVLESAAITIDAYNADASEAAKKDVSISMVARVTNNMGVDIPIGATQGSMSALGYSQSWTISNGATGEIYLSKRDKKILGVGNKIGSCNPLENLC